MLNISKAFDRVWHAGLLHKLRSYGISDQIFGLLFSVIGGFGWFLKKAKNFLAHFYGCGSAA